MGFKTQIDIGFFDWNRASAEDTTRPLSHAEIDEAIVRSGGRLLANGHATEPQLTAIAVAMSRNGKQDVRGFLGREPVVRTASGYAWIALDQRSAGPVAAFVRLLCGELGCGIYLWDRDQLEPTQVLAWLEQLAEQNQAERGTTSD